MLNRYISLCKKIYVFILIRIKPMTTIYLRFNTNVPLIKYYHVTAYCEHDSLNNVTEYYLLFISL